VFRSKVLIVDDDKESRDLLSEVLEANGYAVSAVGDGVAARQALAADGGIQLVIADIRMPNETGLQLLRNLRRQKSRQGIILMSSFISRAEERLARELGAQALLDKPFRIAELLQVVGELAAKKASEVSS
jgi:DNA-binding response OmpR family regulator